MKKILVNVLHNVFMSFATVFEDLKVEDFSKNLEQLCSKILS